MGTHYVSPTGSATWANSTNINTPCALATAIAQCDPGITYLLGGNYSGKRWLFLRGGTASAPVVFAAYNGAPVNLGSGFGAYVGYLTFEDIEVATGAASIAGEKSFQVDNRGAHNVFRRLNIHDCTGSAIGCDALGTPSYGLYEDITVKNVKQHGLMVGRGGDHSVIRRGSWGTCKGPSVISIEGYLTGPDDVLVDGIKITGAHGDGTNDGDGIRVNYATNVTIQDSKIAVVQGYNPDAGGQPHTDQIQAWAGFGGLKIARCTIGTKDYTGSFGDYCSRQLLMIGSSATDASAYTVEDCHLIGRVQTYPILESGPNYQGTYRRNVFQCEGIAGGMKFNSKASVDASNTYVALDAVWPPAETPVDPAPVVVEITITAPSGVSVIVTTKEI